MPSALENQMQVSLTQINQFKRRFHAQIETLDKQVRQVMGDVAQLQKRFDELSASVSSASSSTPESATPSETTSGESPASRGSRRAKS
jgi:peptidoglycan hydrolase CwlO-like protein